MANSKELAEQAFSLLNDALRSSEQRAAELDAELKRKRTPKNRLEQQTDVLSHRLEDAEADRDKWRREAGHLEELLENERAKVSQLTNKLKVAESGPDKLSKKELNFWRQRAEEFDEEIRGYKERLASLRDQLREKTAEADLAAAEDLRADIDASGALNSARKEIESLRRTLRERDSRIAEVSAELENTRVALTGHEQRLAELSAAKAEQDGIIEQLRQENERTAGAPGHQSDEQFHDLRDQLEKKNAELERLASVLAEQRESRSALENENNERNKANGLLEEKLKHMAQALAEERECTDDARQLANERREEIERLVEKLEETEERYEEAKWKLGRAAHFEKLVRKRKKLIENLISEIRAKIKANTALKAGIDGLRTFKATAERNQQKLLARVDRLSDELAEAREAVARQQALADRSELEQARMRAAELEARVQTQVELIGSLEDELKAVKLAASPTQSEDSAAREIEILRAKLEEQHEEIARKKDAIEVLETDIDELQRKLGKLRGSESETMRLRAVREQDHNTIVELEDEIESLKGKLAEAQAPGTSGTGDEPAGAGDMEMEQLRQRLQDQDEEIGRLSEALSGWKKKYEFLAAEAPAAYEIDPKK